MRWTGMVNEKKNNEQNVQELQRKNNKGRSINNQCWGKLILKRMHYNIALLPKKVANYVT